MRNIFLLSFVLLGFAPQQGQPINAMCPVKPKQKSRPNITVLYEGQLIGFC